MRYRTRHCKKEPGKRPLRRKTGRPSGRTGIQHCRHAEGKDPHGNHFPDHPLLSGPDPETGEIAWIALGWKTPRRFPPQWKGRRKIRRPFGSSLVDHRFGCQMLTHLPLNMKNRRPGRAPLREAPTTLESKDQRKFTETKLSKIPFL